MTTVMRMIIATMLARMTKTMPINDQTNADDDGGGDDDDTDPRLGISSRSLAWGTSAAGTSAMAAREAGGASESSSRLEAKPQARKLQTEEYGFRVKGSLRS